VVAKTVEMTGSACCNAQAELIEVKEKLHRLHAALAQIAAPLPHDVVARLSPRDFARSIILTEFS